MILYISGPISGYPHDNKSAFQWAARSLKDHGYEVLNPFDSELNQEDYPEKESLTFKDYLVEDLAMVLKAASLNGGLAMLDSAEWSKGANLEAHVARELGMPVLPLRVWLERSGVKQL